MSFSLNNYASYIGSITTTTCLAYYLFFYRKHERHHQSFLNKLKQIVSDYTVIMEDCEEVIEEVSSHFSGDNDNNITAVVIGRGKLKYPGDRARNLVKYFPTLFSHVTSVEEQEGEEECDIYHPQIALQVTRKKQLNEKISHIRKKKTMVAAEEDDDNNNNGTSNNNNFLLNINGGKFFDLIVISFLHPQQGDDVCKELTECKQALNYSGLLLVECTANMFPLIGKCLDVMRASKSFESVTFTPIKSDSYVSRLRQLNCDSIIQYWRTNLTTPSDEAGGGVFLFSAKRRQSAHGNNNIPRQVRSGSVFAVVNKDSSSSTPRIIGEDGYRQRVGCVCINELEPSQLLIVSSSRVIGRWIIPAGGLELNEDAKQGALREVWEESGARGRIVADIGVFTDEAKKAKTHVFLMMVTCLDNHFQECAKRRRKWIDIREFFSLNKPSAWSVDAIFKAIYMLERDVGFY